MITIDRSHVGSMLLVEEIHFREFGFVFGGQLVQSLFRHPTNQIPVDVKAEDFELVFFDLIEDRPVKAVIEAPGRLPLNTLQKLVFSEKAMTPLVEKRLMVSLEHLHSHNDLFTPTEELPEDLQLILMVGDLIMTFSSEDHPCGAQLLKELAEGNPLSGWDGINFVGIDGRGERRDL